jgi:hypothetical protein
MFSIHLIQGLNNARKIITGKKSSFIFRISCLAWVLTVFLGTYWRFSASGSACSGDKLTSNIL